MLVMGKSAMSLSIALAALVGLLLASVLIAYNGVGLITGALLSAGWGLLGVALFHLVPLLFSGLAWRVLMGDRGPRNAGLFIWARWIREGVNDLLPVAQIGGQFIGARVLTFHGAKGGAAGASVVVDLTVEVVTQFLFTLLGLVVLVLSGRHGEIIRWLIAGVVIAVPLIVAFVLVQRWGLSKLIALFQARAAQKGGSSKTAGIEDLSDNIVAIYRDRRRLLLGGILHLLCWTLGAGEVWLGLYVMGHPIGLLDALVLESLGQAVRSAGFSIPGSLGIQEGGYLLLGGLFGLSPPMALALSLVRRVRDLLLGVPALLVWQLLEGRRVIRRARVSVEPEGQ